MDASNISGAVTPLNFCVYYNFPFERWEQAFRHFFGEESLWLAKGEPPGTCPTLRPSFTFTTDEETFEHLRVLLTYEHEQFHFRHMAGSPLGLVLYIIGGTQYLSMARLLTQWGNRVGADPGQDLTLPLQRTAAGAAEIERIGELQSLYGALQASIMGGLDGLTLGEAATTYTPVLLETLERNCRQALGLTGASPKIVLRTSAEFPAAPVGLTDTSVVEGLARCNEYFLAMHLGAGVETLNRVFLLKHHSDYALALEFASQRLGLPVHMTSLVVAHCADLALQVPWLPFLLEGRDSVAIEELLPGWRFFLLIEECRKRKIGPDEFSGDHRAIARDLFDAHGWEDPWNLAARIEAAQIRPPSAMLSRHYVRTLTTGASLRVAFPFAFVFPDQVPGTHLLGSMYNLFQDRITPGTTGLLLSEPENLRIIELLIDDAVIDSLLMRTSLDLPLRLAERYIQFLDWVTHGEASRRGRHATAEVVRGTRHLLGPAAERVLAKCGISSK
jgi:hypothetical protein